MKRMMKVISVCMSCAISVCCLVNNVFAVDIQPDIVNIDQSLMRLWHGT